MRGMRKGGKRVLLVLTVMSAMLLAAAVPSLAQERRTARVVQSNIVDNIGSARAESGRNVQRGNVGDNDQDAVQDSLSDNLGDDAVQDGIAENVQEQSYEGIGDAVGDTGTADALGQVSDTAIVQEAVNDNVSLDDDGDTDGAGASIEQEAFVNNIGDGEAVSGENDVTGNSVRSSQNVDQTASTVNTTDGGAADQIGDAYNDVTQDVYTDGIADTITGDAIGAGNDSTTTIEQYADNINDDVSTNESGEGASTSQIADVVNDGIGVATSGGNTSTGNYTESSQTSTQVSTSVNTATDSDSQLGLGSNRGSARNRAYGSSTLSTGGAVATGNSSSTTIVSSSYNTNVATDS
ncbi:MAG TPA: hypothetical protein VIK95_13570 [Egibacteraceae bacterium]